MPSTDPGRDLEPLADESTLTVLRRQGSQMVMIHILAGYPSLALHALLLSFAEQCEAAGIRPEWTAIQDPWARG